MDETHRQQLADRWKANEQRLKDARDLKAGPLSPIDRIDELEREQDQIEGELGEMYLREKRTSEASPDQGAVKNDPE